MKPFLDMFANASIGTSSEMKCGEETKKEKINLVEEDGKTVGYTLVSPFTGRTIYIDSSENKLIGNKSVPTFEKTILVPKDDDCPEEHLGIFFGKAMWIDETKPFSLASVETKELPDCKRES